MSAELRIPDPGQASPTSASFADRAIRHLGEWPSLTVCWADSGPGWALAIGTLQIVHLHRPNEAEVHLTVPVVRRIGLTLRETGRASVAPGNGWIQVHVESDSDLALLTSLVSVAIQANAPAERVLYGAQAPCPQAALASSSREPWLHTA